MLLFKLLTVLFDVSDVLFFELLFRDKGVLVICIFRGVQLCEERRNWWNAKYKLQVLIKSKLWRCDGKF